MINKFYIYRHIRLDKNEVFYIGKGTRPSNATYFSKEYARAFSKQGRNRIWHRIVNKTDYEVEIMFESNDENEIFQKETELIELYGRKDLKEGTLANLTFGGEGNTGKIVSEETRKKSSLQRKGVSVHTEKSKKLLSIANKGKNNAMYGKTQSDETKRLISIARTYPLKVTEPDGSVLNFECIYDFKVYYKGMKCTYNIYHDKRGGKPINRGIFKGFKIERLISK